MCAFFVVNESEAILARVDILIDNDLVADDIDIALDLRFLSMHSAT